MQGWIYDVYTQQSGCEGVWLQGFAYSVDGFRGGLSSTDAFSLLNTSTRRYSYRPHPESPHLVHGD